MRLRAERRKKTVKERFKREVEKREKPSEAIKKPSKTGVTLLSRYSYSKDKGILDWFLMC